MRKISLLFFVITSAFIMFSCSTTGYVWDDTIPPEQSAKIWFVFFQPTGYNGIDVNKKEFVIATLPKGAATFSGDVAWSRSGGYVTYTFSTKDAVFSCSLDGGEEYIAWVTYKYDEEKKGRIWGINLYKEKISAKIGGPKDENLIAFIPFNPPVLSN